jgi:hypothetical protein
LGNNKLRRLMTALEAANPRMQPAGALKIVRLLTTAFEI